MKKIFIYISLLFLVTYANAQVTNYESFKTKIENFNFKNLAEKIFVHTDKNAYLAGELLWYKLYYLDGFQNKPLQLSRVAYVELIDQDLKSIFKAKVSLDPSESNGSIHLPLTLGSGIYQFKVYTNYMKNYDENLFFEKQIAVYNTFSNDTAVVASGKNNIALNIFPEGGNIIYGLENSIAYQLIDELGKGVKNEIWLTRNATDTLLHLKSNELGMQKFLFTPEQSYQYHIIANYENGKQIIKQISNIQNLGFNLVLTEKGNQIEVVLNSNEQTSNFRARLVNLLVSSNRVPYTELKSNFQNGIAKFNIDKSILKDGINVITAVNDYGIPFAERLYFKVPTNRLELSVNASKNLLETRTLLDLDISNKNGSTVNSSLSIYRIDSLFNIDESDIFEYIWLSGELKGVVENPSYYFDSKNTTASKDLDLLMMVNGWRRFEWKDLSNNVNKYVPEVIGQIITGKLVNKLTKEPIANKFISYSIPNKYYRYGSAKTDSLGEFSFIVKDIYGIKDIYLQAIDMVDNNHEFILNENFVSEHLTPFARNFSYSTVQNLKSLEEYHLGNQIHNIYHADKIREYKVLKSIDTMPFFQKPMYSFILDNYVRFNTFEEVLREFVSPVNLYSKDKKLNIALINTIYRELHKDNLLVLVDGLQVQDHSLIFQLDPHKFEKIDILSRGYVYGENIYNGIINFKSYEGDLGGYLAPEEVSVVNYEGLQEYRTFYHPSYQSKEAKDIRMPDYRHTMYWNPNIILNEDEKIKIPIYTSDLKGKYIGVLQGIDKDGKAGSYKFTFEVN